MEKKIWLSPPHMGGTEMMYIQQAFDTNWIAPVGANVSAFEKQIEDFIGCGHVAALSSGTAALHLALVLLGVGKGDIVICQSFTFAASANPIAYQSGIPVFVDSEPETWNICPDTLERAIKHCINKGKKPKAIIIVHLYGMPARMDEVLTLCNHYDIPLIEDAAEALGSEFNDRKAGSFGTFGIFSFNGNKIISTSGGGALWSADPALIKKAKFLASQARDPALHYEHSVTGYNYSLSNVCAGIGRGQMEVLRNRVAQRRANNAFYQKALEKLPGINFQKEPAECFSNRWLTALTLDFQQSEISPKKLIAELESENIESRHLWKPMHLQPVFKDAPYFGGNIAGELFHSGICLPSGSGLKADDLQRVTSAITKLFA
ncbi:aminotransferase class I/II-fold pyridoxal phosphate-dependent enzyme [Dyadobacter chenwenxiniae]|uniref:Aminotransferase class I/II-fold pyridoxal phosphate-dependent enzyme n=1 Tax=Dyadobacter chenwenxiniae TaxID=2906456 RepID=A0A9X1THP0_9BACT|nr:aminotransferase class I/II-fold pyridoxal phosphate-dependent enzyme [Dyadobacter chenwenxiniae]MCF0065337.1 aminotransferase class I/II-fold pyridoxal phosphate-dependent enzyme [Dyadobacter chenwenxiniae]UON82250.1 aminotransferase class I/II-fold pyridoxal phosphate-dependent enzyme [Dyadobacter chenwenxiniae]